MNSKPNGPAYNASVRLYFSKKDAVPSDRLMQYPNSQCANDLKNILLGMLSEIHILHPQ